MCQLHVAGLVVNYGISDKIVLEIPQLTAEPAMGTWAVLWWFIWCGLKQTAEQTVEMLVIWGAIIIIMTSL